MSDIDGTGPGTGGEHAGRVPAAPTSPSRPGRLGVGIISAGADSKETGTGVLYATITLTIVVLIFSEVAPKTYAALHAPRIALPVAGILAGLVRLFSPLVA